MKAAIKAAFPRQFYWLQSRRKFWRDYRRDGEWELRELGHLVPKNSLAIDVGGNIGVYTYHLSRLARRVVTFEPNPYYLALLQNLNLPNVRLEAVALSSQPGTASLRVPSVDGRPDTGMASLERAAVSDDKLHSSSVVRTATLDSFAFENTGFIKIDVEGHEERVIDGALRTIARDLPSLLVEIEERHNPGGLDRIATTLGALGYSGFFFENGECCNLEEFQGSRHQWVPPDGTISIAGKSRRAIPYINNFLFVHSSKAASLS